MPKYDRDLVMHYTLLVYVHNEMKYFTGIRKKYAKLLKVANAEAFEIEDVYKYPFIYTTIKEFLRTIPAKHYLLRIDLNYELGLYFNDNKFKVQYGENLRFALLGMHPIDRNNQVAMEHYQNALITEYEKYYLTNSLYYNTLAIPVWGSQVGATYPPYALEIVNNALFPESE